MELPPTTGTARNLILAVIGAKEVGKSHYIAVLIDQIKRRIGPTLDILLEPLDDQTIRRYRSDFYAPIFDRGEVIAGTQSALANYRTRLPLVYSLSFRDRGLLGRLRIRETVSIVFFDTAGEDLDDQDVMSTVNKYVYRADGIILLLDPLQLSVVRDRLGKSVPLPTKNTETIDIITRVTNLILAGRKLKPNAELDVPLAVAFSKFDAVISLVDPQFQLRANPNHHDGFDVDDFDAVNGEMQALLADWRGEDLLHHVKTRYPQHGFFGVSSLGCNPHGTNRIPHVLPKRVEDPFLWLLHRHGFIKATSRSGA